MRRPAVWLFGLAATAAFVACWGGHEQAANPSAAPGQARATGPGSELAGMYRCSIDDGYRYPAFPCVIRRAPKGSQLELTKLAGSQRFHGVVRPRGTRGFTFDGTFFCPFGDCTQELHGMFQPAAGGPPGSFEGRFQDAKFVVELQRADAEFGGDGYGGAAYGGASYGGAMYGNPGSSGRRNRRR